MSEHDEEKVYPAFPEDWDEWGHSRRLDFLDQLGILERYDWENLDGPQRDELIEEYDGTTYDNDTADGEIDEEWVWGESNERPEEQEIDREAIFDEFDIELNVDQLFVEDELELVGENNPSIAVAGTQLPGTYAYSIAGEGYESQYLRELGTEGDGEEEYPAPPGEGDDDGGSNQPEAGEEPPLRITIEAYCAQTTAQSLANLREQDDLFGATIRDRVFEDMEMANFERSLSGEQPFVYDCTIEVQEWREIEVEQGEGAGGDGDSSGTESGTDATERIDDWEGSGTTDEPNIIEVPEGENRSVNLDDEVMRNVEFVIEDGGSVTINGEGDDWAIASVGFAGEEGAAQIVADGSGQLSDIYIPGGEDAIRVESDDVRMDNINTVNSPLERGITVIPHIVESELDIDFYVPPERSPQSYETTVLEAGEHRTVKVQSDETHERMLYDCTAADAHVTFDCEGYGWTLRNIGVIGERSSGAAYIRARGTGGQSRIENVYLGDGTGDEPGGHDVWVAENSPGEITIERVYTTNAPETAIDASNAEGDVLVRNCYTTTDGAAHVRLAGGRGENTVCSGDATGIYAHPPHLSTDTIGITPSGGVDEDALVWNENAGTTHGEVYTAGIEFTSATTVGLAFGVQPDTSGWGDFTGYLAWFDASTNELRLARYEAGSVATEGTAALTPPTDEELTIEIDYRAATSYELLATVYNANGEQLAEASLFDTEYDAGLAGVYRYHASGWEINNYQYTDVTTVHNCELLTTPESSIHAAPGAAVITSYTDYDGPLTGDGRIDELTGNDTTPEGAIPVGCPRDAEEAASGIGAPRDRGSPLGPDGSVGLDPGESYSGTLTTSLDAGEYEVTVETYDDSDSTTVIVE